MVPRIPKYGTERNIKFSLHSDNSLYLSPLQRLLLINPRQRSQNWQLDCISKMVICEAERISDWMPVSRTY